ncbi:dolichyl-phosphate-mannose synthase [Calothrix sp. NIES-4071]|nr:dolichyl-phosphate-mannose synthase [Calothrix sp. NIES-4071]BAZ63855.1 dolichyl-phosphate-mannose synthase [Calothrix sp. NIES-4105]
MSTNQSNQLLPVPSGALQVLLPSIQEADTDSTPWFSLVVPTYNKAANIEKIVQILSELLDQSMPGGYELIVVDDNSPDGTWQKAQSLISEHPQLRVMRREHERGLSSAVIRGWQAARGQLIGVIDGDLQHPPHVLLELITAVKNGADIAVASRHIDGGGVSSWSFTRRLLSRGAQVLGPLILPSVLGRLSDPMSGYFILKRESIIGVILNPVGYKILLEVVGRGRIKEIAEVGYVFCERKEGESKVTWKQYIEYIQHLLKLRFSTGRIGGLRQKLPIDKFLRFALVGFTGVFVDMGLLYLLSDATTLNLPLTRSKIIAGEVAIINNFLLNDAWTFARVHKESRDTINRVCTEILCWRQPDKINDIDQ